MLGHAQAPQQRGGAGLAVEMGGLLELGRGNPGDLLDGLRRVQVEQLLERLVALGALGDERLVGQAVAADDVAEPEHDRGV